MNTPWATDGTAAILYNPLSQDRLAAFRSEKASALSKDDVAELGALADPIPVLDIQQTYLPLAQFISSSVEARQGLHASSMRFLNRSSPKS